MKHSLDEKEAADRIYNAMAADFGDDIDLEAIIREYRSPGGVPDL